jgi:hypothetical protein
MVRASGVILLCLLSGLLAIDAPGGRPELAPDLCTIPLTQVIRIPVRTLSPHDTAESLNAAPATLMIWPGAADEAPDGPGGFDVLDDGSLLITDPLRSHVSSFDSHGRFRKAWKIGFAADSLTVIANGLVLVREASTGRMHAFDREGQTRAAEGGTLPERAEARVLVGQNRGTVMRSAIDNARGGPLAVQLDKPGLTLLSLESLATDQKGDTYVALETTAGGEAADSISLNKYVRRYSRDGKLLCEIADIPLDYYVTPVDELRVHKGVVYQLQTTSSEVRINVWDTNQPSCRPSH